MRFIQVWLGVGIVAVLHFAGCAKQESREKPTKQQTQEAKLAPNVYYKIAGDQEVIFTSQEVQSAKQKVLDLVEKSKASGSE